MRLCRHKTETPGSFVDKEYILRNVPDNVHITLGFEGKSNRFFGKSAVNRYFGIYTLDGNNRRSARPVQPWWWGRGIWWKPSKITLKNCQVKTFKLEGNKLKLYTEDDKELVFDEMTSLDEENAPANNRYTRKAMENRKEK